MEWLVPSNQTNETMNSTTARLFLDVGADDTVLINTRAWQGKSYNVARLYRISHALHTAGVHSTNHATQDLRKEIVEDQAYFNTTRKLHSVAMPTWGKQGGKLRQMEVLVVPTALLDQLFMEALLITSPQCKATALLQALPDTKQGATHQEQALKCILGTALAQGTVNQVHRSSAKVAARDIAAWVKDQTAAGKPTEESEASWTAAK